MYGNNDVCQTSSTTKQGRMNEELRRGPTPALECLNIITKSHPILATQGFQRIQDYALQQQAAKLLHGKSRVCFCGKRKIDKLKNRSVVYNPNTEREHILRMFKDAVLSGIAKSALKRSLKHVEKN